MTDKELKAIAEDAVDSVTKEWRWNISARDRALAVKAAKRAAANAVALALIEERKRET